MAAMPCGMPASAHQPRSPRGAHALLVLWGVFFASSVAMAVFTAGLLWRGTITVYAKSATAPTHITWAEQPGAFLLNALLYALLYVGVCIAFALFTYRIGKAWRAARRLPVA